MTTSKQAIAAIQDRWWPVGGAHENEFRQIALALEARPADALVLGKIFKVIWYYAMPIAEGYSPSGPPNAEGRALLATALACGDVVLDGRVPATNDERLLHFYVRTIQALQLVLDRPTPEQLAACERLCDEVYENINAPVEGEKIPFDLHFRLMVLARRRAWELVFAGPPYAIEAMARLRQYTLDWDYTFGWPMRPLTTDPAWHTWATAEAAAKRPRGERGSLWLDEVIVKRDQPTADELRGRMLFLALSGLDQQAFDQLATSIVDDKLPIACLEVLLPLGFDLHAALVHAVTEHADKVVAALVAAGADPDRGGAKSPRKLAARAKRRAVLAALDAQPTAPSEAETALAGALRAATAKLLQEPWWREAASTFGASQLDLDALLDTMLAGRPESVAELLADLSGTPFEKFAVVVLLDRAGLGAGQRRAGAQVLARSGDLVVAGDLVVDGPIVDDMGGGSLIVSGNVTAHALITEADCLIGGDLTVRDVVWGDYNDGSLVVGGSLTAKALIITDHTLEVFGDEKADLALTDPSNPELVAAIGTSDRATYVKQLVGGATSKPKATRTTAKPTKVKAKATKAKATKVKAAKVKATKVKATKVKATKAKTKTRVKASSRKAPAKAKRR